MAENTQQEQEKECSSMISRATLVNALETVLLDWTEEQYCVGAYARAAGGTSVSPTSARAIRWCSVGIIAKILGVEAYEILSALGAYIAPEYQESLDRIFEINDHSYALAVENLMRLVLGLQE
jgi:hypothetical protein